MNRYEKIAKKLEADYGDVVMHINTFDIFKVPPHMPKRLDDELQQLLQNEMVAQRAETQKRLVMSLKRNNELLDFMQSNGITFKQGV